MADRRLTLWLCKVKAGASEAVTGGGLRESHGCPPQRCKGLRVRHGGSKAERLLSKAPQLRQDGQDEVRTHVRPKVVPF